MLHQRITFTKIVNKHDRLRDNVIEGITSVYPQIGRSFWFTGRSKTPGMIARLVETSPVITIDNPEECIWVLTTQSGSVYRIEYLGEPDTEWLDQLFK